MTQIDDALAEQFTSEGYCVLERAIPGEALDDVTAENGALQVLPYDRPGTREVVPHQKERDSGDFVGFRGDDPGIVVPVPRGSIVALSSTLFHRSGPNITDSPRRAFLASYSAHPITDAKGRVWEQAVPFLRGGVRVHGS